ncbi:GNAT family N-acetyltransferase [Kytococcus sp. Marseille-QA3725]
MTRVHDALVIGAGPFGLGLAALADGVDDLDLTVLDAADGFRWHGGMLIEGATLQVPFMADLVTMADPTSRWSFLNYLKMTGRLYPFYIREDFYPLRAEYDAYCRWAADNLGTVEFGRRVEQVEFDEDADTFVVTSVASGSSTGEGSGSTIGTTRAAGHRTDRARHLVLATGTQPVFPEAVEPLLEHPAHTHSAEYMDRRDQLADAEHITVIGSGQSAAEVFRDQLERLDLSRQHLSWITRSPRFFPMEYTKLTLEMTSPEYTRYFHGLPQAERDRLGRQNLPLYKGISGDLVNEIHEALYRRRLEHGGDLPVTLRAACALESSELADDGTATLHWRHTETDAAFTTTADATILATGYRARMPEFLEPVRDRINCLPDGRFDVALDFTVDDARRIRVMNAEEHTHGLSAPDLGMGPWRAAQIVNDLTGRDVYAVEQRIAFQQFGAPQASPPVDAATGTSPAAGTPPGAERPAPAGWLARDRRLPRMSGLRIEGPVFTWTELTGDLVTTHAPLLQQWLAHPRSRFWGAADHTVERVATDYAALDAADHQWAWLGTVDGEPMALAETYDPCRHPLAGEAASVGLDLADGDWGMHLLVAPPSTDASGEPLHRVGLTAAAMTGVVRDLCLGHHGARRVVVEPDAANDRIRALNRRVGFRELGEVTFTDEGHPKTAMLSLLRREEFVPASPAPSASACPAPTPLVPAHLTTGPMRWAHRHVAAKVLAEFAHERILEPTDLGDGWWSVTADDGSATYRYRATRHALEHWVVDPDSIEVIPGADDTEAAGSRGGDTAEGSAAEGTPELVDAQRLISRVRQRAGIPDALLGTYLEEVAATLAGAAWKRVHRAVPAADLVGADFQALEAAMTEGHPAFVANNGRIGWSLADHERYAPEAGQRVEVLWLAVRRDAAHLALGAGLDEDAFWEREFDPATRERFAATLREAGHDPADYLPLPVHPWQWEHKVLVTFAPEVARGAIVPLGPAEGYQAQQSIRTFFNTDSPDRCYVKTALSVQNMGFLRGLSPAYMRVTPAINDWVHGVVSSDPVLSGDPVPSGDAAECGALTGARTGDAPRGPAERAPGGCGLTVLRELAAVGYTGDAYHEAAIEGPAPAQRKMLAALWRESPVPSLREGETLGTLAAVLHTDHAGDHLASAMVAASGLDPAEWVRRLLHAYLRPVVHCLTVHRLAFMPHTENVIMVWRDGAPVRAVFKDIGEEVAVFTGQRSGGDPAAVPEEARRIVVDVPPEEAALAVFTDVFDGVLRYLAAKLEADGLLDGAAFWDLVRSCIEEHREQFPDDHWVDLLAPEFAHSCLNRLQLRNTVQMVDLTDQSSSLMYSGTLSNPAGRTA